MRRVLLALCVVLGCDEAAPTEPTVVAEASEPDPVIEDPIVDADPGYAGVVLPSTVADVAPTYEGKLESVHVSVGQKIEKGAKLATFDPAAAREAIAIAQAELKVARGRAGEAAAAARHARKRLATEQELYSQGITAADNVTSAQADRAQAGAASATAAGAIAGAKARIQQLERQLEEMDLTAPFSGTVATVYRESGALASPAQPVVRLIDTSKSFVRFAIPPEDRPSLMVGTILDVTLEWGGEPLSAVVRDIAPEVDAPTGMIFIEAELTAESIARGVPNAPVWVSLPAAS